MFFLWCSFEKVLIWLIISRLNNRRWLLLILELKWCFRMLIWWFELKWWSDWFRWRWRWERKSFFWLFLFFRVLFFRQLSFLWYDQFFYCWLFSCWWVLKSSWFESWLCLSKVVLEISIEIRLNEILYDVKHESFLHYISSYLFFRLFDEVFFLKCLIQKFCNDYLFIF